MRSLILILALAAPLPLLAQNDEAASTGSSTSVDIRAKKTWGVGVGFGLFLTPVSGASLQGFYALSGDLQVEGQYWSGTWDATTLLNDVSSVTISKFDVNATQSQLRLKYFVGNSFYLAGGLGMRTIEFDLAASDNTGTRLSGNLKSNATIADLAIGNTWTFDSGFFFGAEWLAFAIPMGAGFSTDFSMTGPYNADISSVESDARKTAKDLGEITTGGLLMLHLGFAF